VNTNNDYSPFTYLSSTISKELWEQESKDLLDTKMMNEKKNMKKIENTKKKEYIRI
jgi:hypothetical protein